MGSGDPKADSPDVRRIRQLDRSVRPGTREKPSSSSLLRTRASRTITFEEAMDSTGLAANPGEEGRGGGSWWASVAFGP